MLFMLLAFVVTIIIIVAIHEYGHYLAMRAFGVRVLTFSIGFGPRLLQWRSRGGTDFVISAIPLGGYVKPLDRRDCELQPGEEAVEFSGKPAWQRVITYAAGPAANLLLAVAIYWVILMAGQSGVAPLVGDVKDDSPAAMAGLEPGDELLALEGRRTVSWQQFHMAMIRYAGEDRDVTLTVRGDDGAERELALPIAAWASDPEQPVVATLGMVAMASLPVLGDIQPNSAAERAGLREGDRVLAVDGEPVARWSDWVAVVQDNPERELRLEIARAGRALEVRMTPEPLELNGQVVGRAGVAVAGVREVRYGPLAALPASVDRLWQTTTMIFSAIGKMVTGNLSWQNLGGPITIAQAAGETASLGAITFLTFLAFFSISLGVINLLPIPMLDGGWIVFGLIEMVRGKALPEKFLMAAQSLGMTLVFALMLLAIYNDLLRQFS